MLGNCGSKFKLHKAGLSDRLRHWLSLASSCLILVQNRDQQIEQIMLQKQIEVATPQSKSCYKNRYCRSSNTPLAAGDRQQKTYRNSSSLIFYQAL